MSVALGVFLLLPERGLHWGQAGIQAQHRSLGSPCVLHWLPPPQAEISSHPSAAGLLEMLPRVSETSVLSLRSKETLSPTSTASGAPICICVKSSFHSGTPSLAVSPRGSQNYGLLSSMHAWRTCRTLSQTLSPFSSLAGVRPPSLESDALPSHPLLLERMDWSQSKMMDLGSIDALNFFCEQQRVRRLSSLLSKEPERPRLGPRRRGPNAVVPQPRPHL